MIPENKMRGVRLVVKQYCTTGDDGQLREDLGDVFLVIDSLPVTALKAAAGAIEGLIHEVERDIDDMP